MHLPLLPVPKGLADPLYVQHSVCGCGVWMGGRGATTRCELCS
jgi:hypothetical protein